ncbi:alpha/beta hydrolase [Sphingomonas sp. LB-2]|uniref:alpha/beta hydrolase n=1 Tax=Sphingomonas caeni TaxID=2984949 RepID=UPI0022318C1A|nr:alpha/beta hydrolase [Sphingomonas caeni]MCW3849200.1 alpha/beta hydrolase [Sphingomonas caeni]
MGRQVIWAGVMMLAVMAVGCGSSSSPTPAAASPQEKQGQPTEIALWPAGLAIARPELTGPEEHGQGKNPVAGRPLNWIKNVERPTMMLYRAKGRNTGAALMVFPGGGYQALAIDLEGSEICDWATARGITCVVLKYRVPQTWWHTQECHCQRMPQPFLPLQDAQRAIGLLRQRAASLGIDPHKIGVVGFSAGGHLVTAVANAAGRSYKPVDAADALSARPDFAMPLYPGHLWYGEEGGEGVTLYPFNTIAADGPPTFMVQAEDDPVDDVRHSIAYFLALREKKVPVEIHIYARGGHAFGVRRTAEPITHWTDLAEKWLHTIGIL